MGNVVIPVITLKPKEERRILRGHLWVYRNEVASLPTLQDGDVADVFSSSRRFVGRGFYQQDGGIAVRIIAHHQHDIEPVFFRERLSQARILREQLFGGSSVYRWVFGESDLLPGLVIDRYDTVAVIQSDCVFYERYEEMLIKELLAVQGVTSVMTRFSGTKKWAGEKPDIVSLLLDGVRISLDFSETQKTGLFLDQRCNWRMMQRYATGKSVLDGCCYHGLWSIHAGLADAASVLGVDTSSSAIDHARRNCSLNGLETCIFEQADIEEKLAQGHSYDVIVLDPPAFAKHRAQTKKALSRYENLNALAMTALSPGGILIACSCSHFVSAEEFLEVLKRAARTTGRHAQLLEMHGAAPDHPVLLTMPETAYLKCAALRML